VFGATLRVDNGGVAYKQDQNPVQAFTHESFWPPTQHRRKRYSDILSAASGNSGSVPIPSLSDSDIVPLCRTQRP
jgi:hypothetical protein